MRRLIWLLACGLAWLPAGAGPASRPEVLMAQVTALVREHFPAAVISQQDNNLVAKHNTMIYTLKAESKTGRSDKLVTEEGPNRQGFLLVLTVQQGAYTGQADLPQTVSRQFWETYVDRPSTPDGLRHYYISFSYGPRLKPAFKQALQELLPKTGGTAPE